MIHCLLFDLDNTLVDRNAAHRRYWEWCLIEHFCRGRRKNTVDRDLLDLLVAEDQFGYRGRSEYFSWASEFLGLWTCDQLWEHYRYHLPRFIESDSQIISLLQGLRRGRKLALVSNGSSQLQRAKLERAGLAGLFECVIISDEVGFAKPSLKIFRCALEKLQTAPGEALFIGDDPLRDIRGAAAIGCRTCWISHNRVFPHDLAKPDWTISSVLQLPEVLACRTVSALW